MFALLIYRLLRGSVREGERKSQRYHIESEVLPAASVGQITFSANICVCFCIVFLPAAQSSRSLYREGTMKRIKVHVRVCMHTRGKQKKINVLNVND